MRQIIDRLRSHRTPALVGAVLAILFAASSQAWSVALAVADEPPGCEAGEALLQDGQLDLAETQFTAALDQQDGVTCAIDGLVRVAKARRTSETVCEAADVLMQNGKFAEAEAMLLEAAKTTPTPTCLADAIARVVNQRADLARYPEKFTTRGFNLLPSIAYPVSAFVTATGVLIMVVAVVWWRFTKKGLFIFVLLLGIGAVLIGVLILGAAEPDATGCCSAVRVSPIAIPPDMVVSKTPEVLGRVTSTDGSTAKVVLDKRTHQALVTNIHRAGQYDGKLPANGGLISISAQIRDIAPYALMAIAVGVLLGFALHRYFAGDRSRYLLRARANRLWDAIAAAEVAYSASTAARHAGGLSLALIARACVVEAWSAVDQGTSADVDAASKRLEALEAVRREFAGLQDDVKMRAPALDDLIDSLGTVGATEDVPIVRDARERLEAVFPGVTLPKLEIVEKAREELRDRFDAVVELDADVRGLVARELLARTRHDALRKQGVGQDKLTPIANEMTKAHQGLMEFTRTPSVKLQEDYAKALAAFDTVDTKIREATPQTAASETGDDDGDESFIQKVLDMLGVSYFRAPSEDSWSTPTWITAPHRRDAGPPPEGATLTAEVLSPSTGESGGTVGTTVSGSSDDLFVLTATVPGGVGTAPYRIRTIGWASAPFQRTNGARLSITTMFATPGERVMDLVDASGTVLDSATIRVEASHRAAESSDALRRADAGFAALGAALAIGSGFLALYTTTPVWGTPADYLKATLWGATVSEGVRFAANAVAGKWIS